MNMIFKLKLKSKTSDLLVKLNFSIFISSRKRLEIFQQKHIDSSQIEIESIRQKKETFLLTMMNSKMTLKIDIVMNAKENTIKQQI